MYNTGSFNFLYANLVLDSIYGTGGDMQPFKSYAIDKYNLYAYPSTYTDGGESVLVGGYPQWGNYSVPIQNSGTRAVPDVDFTVSMNWLGSASAEITVTITNNEYENYPPDTPSQPTGAALGVLNGTYEFTSTGTDPNRQQVYYKWDWGDGEITDWLGPYDYQQPSVMSHTWTQPGQYYVSTKIKDIYDVESDWSNAGFVDIWECGNVDDKSDVNILDVVYIINYKYKDGPAPIPEISADVDNSGTVSILDVVYIINYKYKEGPAPNCPSQ